jgi:hypothetical protein
MDELLDSINDMSVKENEMVEYVNNLLIKDSIKNTLIRLIYNDNYTSYIDIYNICTENDIELPPI